MLIGLHTHTHHVHRFAGLLLSGKTWQQLMGKKQHCGSFLDLLRTPDKESPYYPSDDDGGNGDPTARGESRERCVIVEALRGSAAVRCLTHRPLPRSANTGICHHLVPEESGVCLICGTLHPSDDPKDAGSKKRKTDTGIKPKQKVVRCCCIVKLMTVQQTTSATPNPAAPAAQAAQRAAALQVALAAHPDVAKTGAEKDLLHVARSLPIPQQLELTKLATAVSRVRQSVPDDATAASLVPEAAQESAKHATPYDLTMAHLLSLAPLPPNLNGHMHQLLRHAAAVVAVHDAPGEVAAATPQQRTAEGAATCEALDRMAQQIEELQLQAGQPPARPASTADNSDFAELVEQVQAQRDPDGNTKQFDERVLRMVGVQLGKEQLKTVGSVAGYLHDSVQKRDRCDELKKLGMTTGLAGDVLKLLDLG